MCVCVRERESFIDILSPLSRVCRLIYLPPCVCPFIPTTCFHFSLFLSSSFLSVHSSLCTDYVISMFVSVSEDFLAFWFFFSSFNFHFDITLVARMAWKQKFLSIALSLSLSLSQFLLLSLSLHALARATHERPYEMQKCFEKKKAGACVCCYIPCGSEIWTSLTLLWWFGFRLKPI